MTPLLLLLLAVSSQTPTARIDWLLQHAGELQSQRQRHADLAIPFLRQAVDLATASQDNKREAQGLSQLGDAYRSTHHLDEAVVSYKRAIDLARAASDSATEADGLAGLGGLHVDRGEYLEAQR